MKPAWQVMKGTPSTRTLFLFISANSSFFPVVFSSLSPSLFAPARKAIIKLWCFLSYWTSLSDSLLPKVDTKTVPDPDLEIRGWGRSSRPLHKGGGGDCPPKIFFQPLRPQFGLKIRGGCPPRVPPLDPTLQELFSVIHLLFSMTLSMLDASLRQTMIAVLVACILDSGLNV